eukprot:scaffold2015_cov186-Amphora_coffeaeformis.AAC.5
MKDSCNSRIQLALLGGFLMIMTLALDARALWMHRSMSTTGYELPPDESVIPWLPSTWSEDEEQEEYTVEDAGTVDGARVAVTGNKEAVDVVPETTTDSKTETEASDPKEDVVVNGHEDNTKNEKEKVTKQVPVADIDSSSSSTQTNLRGASVAR